ncbi:hypothetical protein TEA_005119 [Camellia sinensis var. sinensis]|uniref:Bet v I/Major latex protein domain-containing protein n=1 Tax=Camellia sinensis var. sinensis TaxID=542762 RepID=A0A4S4ES10_CAMSN|nr:hypothetical protein TEA_005119 [Camellia sinensis var. sinensis]
MGLTGKLVRQVEIKSDGDVFHELFRDKPHHISTMSPGNIHGVDLHEGDWGHVGSVISWNYTHGDRGHVGTVISWNYNEKNEFIYEPAFCVLLDHDLVNLMVYSSSLLYNLILRAPSTAHKQIAEQPSSPSSQQQQYSPYTNENRTSGIDRKKKVAKEVVEAIDEENKSATFKVIDGDLTELYKAFKGTVHVDAKGENNLVTWTFEYEKKSENVEDPNTLMDFLINVTKDIETHHLNRGIFGVRETRSQLRGGGVDGNKFPIGGRGYFHHRGSETRSVIPAPLHHQGSRMGSVIPGPAPPIAIPSWKPYATM